MKKVSVIIPAYNNQKELSLTINSIIEQKMPLEDIEVIVCDDGSEPRLETLCGDFGNRVDVKYHWQEDKGFRPGAARNMGIRAAVGELCLFLDSGVIVTSDCLLEHYRTYQEQGERAVILGYVYGNDLKSDLEEMREIIDNHAPDEAAELMRQHGMATDGRERDYAACGDELWRWQAPWMELWSLHFSVPASFMRDEGIYFDEWFCAWGCEDNDFGIRLHEKLGRFVLAREAVAIHYPAKVRSYDRLHNDPDFRAGWLRNKAYLKEKHKDHELVQKWLTEGGKVMKELPLLSEEEAAKYGRR